MDFIDSILPGNYNLTKSMEISKLQSSGTLWYTKKFLVLYNIIFLTDKLKTIEYIEEINNIFNKYIKSMERDIQDDAKKFFFNGKDCFSLDYIRSYNNFIENDVEFDTIDEKNRFISTSKKYYFAYLMGSGGQSGIKKRIKDEIYSEDFKFSLKKLKEIIVDFNNKQETDHKVNGIINDYVAFIRNERQILYYFGYFHSKTSGAKDLEFSSLTPVGEMAYLANHKEFHMIWEHQKIKMISQPANVEIKNLNGLQKNVNVEKFGINNKPYFDILQFLKRYKNMNKEEYKYIVSRNKNECDIFKKNEKYTNKLIENIHEIEKNIQSFGRRGDLKDEDFNKELKKYILGISSNMILDKGTNVFGVIKEGSKIEIYDEIKFNKIFNMYKLIEEYKSNKYSDLFYGVNKELKEYYKAQVAGKSYLRDKVIRTNWNLYNGLLDSNIILMLMILYVNLEGNIDIKINKSLDISNYIMKDFPNIFKSFSLKVNDFRDIVELCIKHIDQEIIIDDLFEKFDDELDTVKYIEDSLTDIEYKIDNISEKEEYVSLERKRNTSLINLMRTYYRKKYDKENNDKNLDTSIKCECCEKTTFITDKNLPYMEFHHIIPFGGSTKGQDHYLNLINLCPTCHTKIHRISRNKRKELYININKNNYMNLTLKERLLKLKEQKMLKSYQLEFLYAEDAITESEYEEIGEYHAI